MEHQIGMRQQPFGVGDREDRHVRDHLRQDAADLRLGRGVERRRRFVQDQNAGLAQ